MKKLFALFMCAIGWFAVITQFKLMMDNRVASVSETIIRFFSFFTILTNTIAAIYFTLESLKVSTTWFNSKSKSEWLTAITVFITVVGLVYQILLRHIWNPVGLQRLVDELLHTFIPVFVVVYWVLFENKTTLRWNMIPKWLIYPLAYLGYVLLRGHFSGFYPYPFVDVTQLGTKSVLINSFFMTILFVVLALVFVYLGKRIKSGSVEHS